MPPARAAGGFFVSIHLSRRKAIARSRCFAYELIRLRHDPLTRGAGDPLPIRRCWIAAIHPPARNFTPMLNPEAITVETFDPQPLPTQPTGPAQDTPDNTCIPIETCTC
jgi:hypothetical protein